MDCINTHVNGVYREVWGRRRDDTLDRTLCSTVKLGNLCLGVLLLLWFFMDLGSMLHYTPNSLHPEGPRWPLCSGQSDRGKKNLDFPADLCPPAPDRAKETSAGEELRKGKQHSMQKLHLPDWNKLCRYLSLVTLERCCFPFFKVCSKAKSSLRTGIFADTLCATSLENQLVMSSGFVSMRLDRRTKSSWAVAHDMAFCARILSCPCWFFTPFPSQSHLVPILTRTWGSGHAWLPGVCVARG